MGISQERPEASRGMERSYLASVGVATRLMGSHHAMGLVMSHTHTTIRLAGDVDIAAADDLSSLLERLELVSMAVSVDLNDVTFLDCSGLRPLIDAIRSRACNGLGSLWIAARSRQAQFFFDATGLGGNPHLDLAAWDRLPVPP